MKSESLDRYVIHMCVSDTLSFTVVPLLFLQYVINHCLVDVNDAFLLTSF